MNPQPIPAFNPEEIPRIPTPAPDAMEQWWRIPLYPDPVQMNPQPIPAFNPEEIPRIPTPAPDAMEQWWRNDWKVHNLINDPNPYYPYNEIVPAYNEPVPAVFPLTNPENVAELRHYGEELIDAGNKIRNMGENLVRKYEEREL
ncbi:hypothetical protein Hanom_Chr16g01474171 [Helianthus anomalus]